MSTFSFIRCVMVLCVGSLYVLSTTGCGSAARSGARTASGLPEEISGGQAGITLSIDPTEVPVIRLSDAADTLRQRNPGDYRIGIGDKIKVSVLSRNLSDETDGEEVIVRQDGKIYLRLLGEIQAEGMTIIELQDRVLSGAQPFVKQPFIQVEMVEYNSQFAIVFGELSGVQNGGGRGRRVPLKGPTPLMELFSTIVQQRGDQAQDFSASPSLIGDLSNLIVTRHNGERLRVNLNTYLFGMNHDANIEIRNGDFIFVPNIADNRVFVLGEVNNQGPLPIGLGMTVAEAVVRAGGFTNLARRNDVKVIRGGIENPELIEVAALDVARKGLRTEDVPLRNGDILYIPRSPLGDLNVILQQIVPPLQTYLLIQALLR